MVSIILRQLDLDTASVTERRLFDLAYPGFAKGVEGRRTLTVPLPPPSATNASRLHTLGETEHALFHELTKPRRYAGGSDLGRQRYHAVVGSEDALSDDGTLISEIQEYWDPDRVFHTGSVALLDGATPKDRQHLADLRVEWDHDPSTIICVFSPLHEPATPPLSRYPMRRLNRRNSSGSAGSRCVCRSNKSCRRCSVLRKNR